MSDNYLLISSDCHAGPPAGTYRDYLDPTYRGAYDEFVEQRNAMRRRFSGGEDTGGEKFREDWVESTGDGGLQAAWDPGLRDKYLDDDGVAGEIIFPDADVLGLGGIDSSPFASGLGSSGAGNSDHKMAGARAHNRWLAEFCATSPARHAGVAIVTVLDNIDAAVEEIHWAAGHGITGGILIPSIWAPYPAYHDTCYDPVWAACAETKLTVHVHSGGMASDIGPGPGFMEVITSESWFWPMRPLWVMLWGGVFERHPDLHLAITEDGAWWVPGILDRADEKFVGTSHNVRKFGDNAYRRMLSMKPSEYFGRNIFIGASTPTPEEIELRHRIGISALMWGNDFPHPEGTWPYTRDWIAIRYRDVPQDETRKMLGLNALTCYPLLDAPALAATAARIGPTPHDVHEAPLPDNPDAR